MKTKNIKNMYHQFSGLLQTPFYIHLFGQILNSFTDFNEKEFAAFSLKWYEILLDNITKNKEENERLSDLIEKIIFEYSNAIVHAFQKFKAPFSGKIVHIFPEQSAVI